jgi:hypothetical protein
LSIKIYRDRSKRLIGLSQDAYINKILNQFNIQDSKKCFLAMSHGNTLSKKQCPMNPYEQERMRAIPYASAIGYIMYAMIYMRPDVSYTLSAMSRYQSNYGESHWIIIKNILKGYNDASFQTDADDCKSQSDFVFCLNRGAVSWKSSKQDTIVDSMMKDEYIAASEAAKKVVWIRNFVSVLGVVPSASNPMDLYCDNSGAIVKVKEHRAHKRAKHILRYYHLIHEIIGRGDVKVCKIHIDHNVADPLTKPLPQPKHEAHMRSMGIRYLHE